MDIGNLNKYFEQYTIVHRMHFDMNSETLKYGLFLNLLKDEVDTDDSISIYFEGISHFSLKEFGDGLSQFELLYIRKIKEFVAEGLNYEVSELEEENISFLCEDVQFLDK